jgi:hypothetical protein
MYGTYLDEVLKVRYDGTKKNHLKGGSRAKHSATIVELLQFVALYCNALAFSRYCGFRF